MALAALLLISSLALSRADDAGIGVSDDEETEEVEDQGPHLVARKFLPGKDLVVGRNSTVAIELYNAGNSAAYEVVVRDGEWQAEYFEFDPASMVDTVDRIPAGGTARVEFTVIPLKTGAGVISPAKITYKAEEDASKVQNAYSTTLRLSIITPFNVFVTRALRWGSYATLGQFKTLEQWRNALIITAVLALVGGGFWVYTSVSESRKRQIYQKALDEVEKMK
ncbi:g4862 [Coccomyxa elongata]